MKCHSYPPYRLSTTTIHSFLEGGKSDRIVFQPPILTITTTITTIGLIYIEPINPRHTIGRGIRIQRRDLIRPIRVCPDTSFRDEDWHLGEFADLTDSRAEYRIIRIAGRVIISVDTHEINPC